MASLRNKAGTRKWGALKAVHSSTVHMPALQREQRLPLLQQRYGKMAVPLAAFVSSAKVVYLAKSPAAARPLEATRPHISKMAKLGVWTAVAAICLLTGQWGDTAEGHRLELLYAPYCACQHLS